MLFLCAKFDTNALNNTIFIVSRQSLTISDALLAKPFWKISSMISWSHNDVVIVLQDNVLVYDVQPSLNILWCNTAEIA